MKSQAGRGKKWINTDSRRSTKKDRERSRKMRIIEPMAVWRMKKISMNMIRTITITKTMVTLITGTITRLWKY